MYSSMWLSVNVIAILFFHFTYGRIDRIAPNPLGAIAAISLTFAANTAYVYVLANARNIPKQQIPVYIATAALLTPVIDLALAALYLQLSA